MVAKLPSAYDANPAESNVYTLLRVGKEDRRAQRAHGGDGQRRNQVSVDRMAMATCALRRMLTISLPSHLATILMVKENRRGLRESKAGTPVSQKSRSVSPDSIGQQTESPTLSLSPTKRTGFASKTFSSSDSDDALHQRPSSALAHSPVASSPGSAAARSPSMSIDALVWNPGEMPDWLGPGGAYPGTMDNLFSGALPTGAAGFWDGPQEPMDPSFLAMLNSAQFPPSIEVRRDNQQQHEAELRPLYSIQLASAPQLGLGMFDDLPLPSDDVLIPIFRLFFDHINPEMGYIVHPPSFLANVGYCEPLLMLAMLATAAPLLPDQGQAISLKLFRRAQRLLQPMLDPLLRGRKPTVAQLAAILCMSTHATTSFSSSQLGYQLGMVLVLVMSSWGLTGQKGAESKETELKWAFAERRLIESSSIAGTSDEPIPKYYSVIEREMMRRVIWKTWDLDKAASVAIPLLGPQHLNLPLMPDPTISSILLPCDDVIWVSTADPVAIVAALPGATGQEIVAPSPIANPALAYRDRRWWDLRLRAILSKIVEFHTLCLRENADPACLPPHLEALRNRLTDMLNEDALLLPLQFRPFSQLNPNPTATDIWRSIIFHWCFISLYSPRKGSGLDPSLLLGNAAWLSSPGFAVAAAHSVKAAELIATLDVVDPYRFVLNPAFMPAGQVCGTLAFIRLVVARRALDWLDRQEAPVHNDSTQKSMDILQASEQLALDNLRVIRRHQMLFGRRSRLMAQMAVFLGTMERRTSEFVQLLENGEQGKEATPVIWTEHGLVLRSSPHNRVLVGWDQMVPATPPAADEWSDNAAVQNDTIIGKSSPLPQGAEAGIAWKWRIVGANEAAEKLDEVPAPR